MFFTQEYKEQWSQTTKLIFRFLCSYFTFFIFFLLLSSLFETPIRCVGEYLLKVSYKYDISGYGSGDHTFAYISLFVSFILCLITTITWSILDYKRKNYNKLLYWFLISLRIVLIASMLLYGFIKIFQIQFPYPSLTRLLEPLGNFSPMGLAWTYMGYSKGFNMFAGLMEILGGLLLIPRRTQTLGAFIVAGVMTQVVVMNFMFDIPVKLFSTHLTLMALVIFMTDIKRFSAVFISNKSVEKYEYYSPIKDKSYPKVIFWIKTIGLTLAIIGFSIFGYITEDSIGKNREKPHLYGIWETSTFIKNGDTLPPLITDFTRWRYLIIDQKGSVVVKTMDEKKHHYNFELDSSSQQIKMTKNNREVKDFNLKYNHSNFSSLELKGDFENDSIEVILKKKDINEFLLNSRGFHWINESPLNK